MKRAIVFLVFCMFMTAAFAQSADKVTDILNSPKATYGQASYICASAKSLIEDDASYEEAFQVLKEEGFIKGSHSADEPIKIKHLAKLCVKTWDVQNSIMYRITGASRYALRVMKAEGVIADSKDPSSIPSGIDLLNIITACLDRYETSEFEQVED